ncbi:MAG: ATP-binding protein, partial [Solirubrobacteraceae bacterium]
PSLLVGPAGQVALRVVQEALTNVRKHAPGAAVSVTVGAAEEPRDGVVVLVENPASPHAAGAAGMLAGAGGGYGLRGMRERAQELGGTLSAGPVGEGWRVELRLPGTEPAVGRAPATVSTDAP